jgi:hypothetical protein
MPTEQLQVMVKNLRAEVGHSLATAQGVNQVETIKYLLQRTQEELWTAFTWPELSVRIDTPLMPGQFLYPFPAAFTFDQVRSAWSSRPGDTEWGEVGYGIEEDRIEPGGNNSRRADPITIWDVENSGGTVQFRVWPTPDTSGGYIRFKGNRSLAPFLADSDVSTLDDNVIVLFAASEILARAKAEDADLKQQKAQRHLLKLLGSKVSAKMRVSTLGGGAPALRGRVDNLSYSSTHWKS